MERRVETEHRTCGAEGGISFIHRPAPSQPLLKYPTVFRVEPPLKNEGEVRKDPIIFNSERS